MGSYIGNDGRKSLEVSSVTFHPEKAALLTRCLLANIRFIFSNFFPSKFLRVQNLKWTLGPFCSVQIQELVNFNKSKFAESLNCSSRPSIHMLTLVLCLKGREGKQEMEKWGVVNLTGSGGWRKGDAGGLERSTSLLLCSSSSSSLQSAADRRSLIGNEPWRHRPSRHQQIATTYRLWRGNSSPPPPLLFLHRSSFAPSLSLSLHFSLPVFMGTLWFIWGSVEVTGTESSILLLLICHTLVLTYQH